MAKQFLGPRKQRTRQHVIADQSVHYVEGFILAEGHTAQRLERDYGYDLLLFTYDEQGYVEPGFLFFQVKAAEAFQAVGSDYVFDLDVRDYNLWMQEETPVILVLFDATRRRKPGSLSRTISTKTGLASRGPVRRPCGCECLCDRP